ncbi:MAG: transcriptional repressor [Deltaproteobacteria bacterium]|nr:transcriptional repressor [Deltaproteobacteria bacterium]MBW2420393.1 transcriptional repressor [Deltaproteobacteria bacterium]
MAHEAERAALSAYLEEKSLKHTKQRDVILDAFLDARGHATSEELYQLVREVNPNIGYTTVYRTMKLLVDAGIAQERHFDDGIARYEIEHQHHDHLVCLKCGKIVEFESPLIEATQEQIAADYKFVLKRHRHELYGYCSHCVES